MSVTVRIPSAMRPLAGGASTVEVAGTNVKEVLDALIEAHPGTRVVVQSARYTARKRYKNPAPLSVQPAAMLMRNGNAENEETPVQANRSILLSGVAQV